MIKNGASVSIISCRRLISIQIDLDICRRGTCVQGTIYHFMVPLVRK